MTIKDSSGGTFYEHDVTDPNNNSWTDDADKVTSNFVNSESGTYMGMLFSSSGSGNTSTEIIGISYPGGFNQTGGSSSNLPPNGASSGSMPGGVLATDMGDLSEQASGGYQSAVGAAFAVLTGTFMVQQAPNAPAIRGGQPYTPQERMTLTPQELQDEINGIAVEIAGNTALGNAFATLGQSVGTLHNTAVTFNLGLVQFDSLLLQGIRDVLGNVTGLIKVSLGGINCACVCYLRKAVTERTYLSQLRQEQRAQVRMQKKSKMQVQEVGQAQQ